MSQVNGGGDPPIVAEGEGGVAGPPTLNEGKDNTVTTPMLKNGQGMGQVSPVMSYEMIPVMTLELSPLMGFEFMGYEKGTDHIESVTKEGEFKDEGKAKGRGTLAQCNS